MKRVSSGSVVVLLAFSVALAQVSDPDAVKRRALALAQAGDYAQARADLERLVSERPNDRLARKLLARVLIAASASSEAASQLEHLVRTDNTDAEAWSLLGRLYQDAQRFGVAAEALEHAARLDGSDVAALTALANAYVGLSRFDAADVTFARAIRTNDRRANPAAEPHASYAIFLLRVSTYCHPRHYAPLPNQLFRNNRDGTFRDVSIDSGIARHLGKGMGAAVGDVDDDGWPDVFVANDTEPNFLFRNRGDGTFENVAEAWGVAVNQFGSPVSSMGADLRDIDNDGRLDLFVTDLSNEGFLLFRNMGTHFDDVSDQSGITLATLPYAGWSNPVADYNNDGWKDLFSANGHVTDNVESIQGRPYRQGNSLLLNRGNGTFRDASSEGGDLSKPGAHRGAAVVDLDNDGRLDLVVTALGERANILRNVSTSTGQWLLLQLVGRASNRNGLGTIIGATLDDGRVLVSHATTSVGFASSSDPRVHFGVPPNRRVAHLTLRWPSGAHQTIENPALNRILTIEEPER